jgi:hypothetical protein
VSRLWLLVLFALLFASPAALADPPGAIDPASRAEGERLLGLLGDPPDLRLGEASPRGFSLQMRGGDGRVQGALNLRRGVSDHMPRFRSRSYSMEIASYSMDERVTTRLIHAAWVIARADGGIGENRDVRQPAGDLSLLRDATLALIALAAVLGVLRNGRVVWEIRLPHLIPAIIQALIFLYWSVYWSGVRDHASSIAMQLALAFAADAAFSFARTGLWRVGASPFPVVLSTNLFVWFNPPGVILSILVAFASKAFLHRSGRHFLNPSAMGLSVTGLLSYAAPGLISVGGLFHLMNLAPNIAELMVLLAILPQMRFRILPISIAAVAALRFENNPTVLRPPMILAVALLATDPSTIPKTDAGKALFGLLIGFGIVFSSWALRTAGYIDDFAKVLPIPLANLLVPHLDRLGAAVVTPAQAALARAWKAFRRRDGAFFQRPVPNLLFVATWLLITLAPMGAEKPSFFEPSFHWNFGTPLVVRDADDVPRCESNPVFCRPFTFAQEIALWRQRAARQR